MKKIFFTAILINLYLLASAQNTEVMELKFGMDNDIFAWYNNSDRYYTYGLFASLSYKSKKNPKWAIFENKEVVNEISYGLQAYTPGNFTDNDDPLSYDRPFAGWNYIGYGKRLNSQDQSLFIGTTIGILGPAAAAGRIQNWFHGVIGDDYVDGWDNQVKNQFGINLLTQFNKKLWGGKNTDLLFESHNSLGSIFTHSTNRIRMRIGKFSPINSSVIYGNRVLGDGKSELFFTTSVGFKAVGYNATLQGGIFNNEQLLPASDLNRGVGLFSYGLYYAKKKFSAGAEIIHTRGEVAKTLDHKYGTIWAAFTF